ncbi:MAG: hypothetical protein HY717_00680 [Planctomycetes bacterium]|nr:hypothetical protein [Planctomycetota bacterium]
MTFADLEKEVTIEFELMESTVKELVSLLKDVGEREPTIREKTAAAAFLAQFYNGVEHIMKRICRYHGVDLPTGDTWHSELFKRFCSPGFKPLPILLGKSLASNLAPYRNFRHVVFHSYGFQLEWSRMIDGIRTIQKVFRQFKKKLTDYLENQKESLP